MQPSITFSKLASGFCLLLGVSLVALSVGCNSKSSFDKSRLHTWTASGTSANELGPEETVFGIKIRPPKGFIRQPEADVQGVEGGKITSWVQKRDDGTMRAIQLMTAPIPDGQDSLTHVQATKQLIGGIKRGKSSWQEFPVDVGLVEGREFCRLSWTATSSITSMDMLKGHLYVTIIDGKIFQLATQDLKKFEETDLEVCQASILSFRK